MGLRQSWHLFSFLAHVSQILYAPLLVRLSQSELEHLPIFRVTMDPTQAAQRTALDFAISSSSYFYPVSIWC